MEDPTSKPCCRWSLRTGAFIWGSVGLVAAILDFLRFFFLEDIFYIVFPADGLKMLVIMINSVLSVILLYGVFKDSRRTMLTVIYVQLGLSTFYFGTLCAVYYFHILNIWLLMLFFIFGSLISVYCLWTEFSYDEELEERTENSIYVV